MTDNDNESLDDSDENRSLDIAQLNRWAKSIADGECTFPANLPDCEQEALASEVRLVRRNRLIAFIARLIANSIHERR